MPSVHAQGQEILCIERNSILSLEKDIMEATSIAVTTRNILGKRVSALRKQGLVPLHLYGGPKGPLSLQGDASAVVKAVSQVGFHLPVYLEFGESGEKEAALVKEIQRDPISSRVMHVDFLRVDITQITTADIPIVLTGESSAVKRGGRLNQTISKLQVQCLPMDMPAQIDFDLSSLTELGSFARVSDLTLPPGITILSDEEEIVVRVSAPRRAQATQSLEQPVEITPAEVQVIGEEPSEETDAEAEEE